MNTDNEREIHGRLDAALGTITPPGPPVAEVLRHGRTIRMRRRAVAAAGLAAVVGLGIALPGLVAHVGATPSLTHSYTMTVNPPRSTPSKLTFSGTINGKRWRIYLTWQRKAEPGVGHITQIGPDLPFSNVNDLSPDGQPASFQVVGGGSTPEAWTGQVRSDIKYLALNLPGGSSVDMAPVRWHGARWVAFRVPPRPWLRSVAAYSRGGEVAYAVPFGASLETWLQPGQHGLARQTVPIGSGTINGRHWSFTGYAGPWGLCLHGENGTGGCFAGHQSVVRRGQLVGWLGCGTLGLSARSEFWNGQAASGVSYLEFRLAGGSPLRVVPVRLAGYRYFAVAYGDQRPLTWTAYGTSGQVLGHGSVSPRC